MNLYTDHLKTTATPEGVIREHEYLGFLRDNGYNVNSVSDTRVVGSETKDHAYLIARVETLKLPTSHPESDVVVDGAQIIVCSCDDWHYNQSADVSESGVHPTACGKCKHIIAEFRAEQARDDDSQDTLV